MVLIYSYCYWTLNSSRFEHIVATNRVCLGFLLCERFHLRSWGIFLRLLKLLPGTSNLKNGFNFFKYNRYVIKKHFLVINFWPTQIQIRACILKKVLFVYSVKFVFVCWWDCWTRIWSYFFSKYGRKLYKMASKGKMLKSNCSYWTLYLGQLLISFSIFFHIFFTIIQEKREFWIFQKKFLLRSKFFRRVSGIFPYHRKIWASKFLTK